MTYSDSKLHAGHEYFMVDDEEFYDEHFMGDEERFYDEHFYLYQIYRVLNFTVCTAEQANPPITIVGW